MKKLPKKTEKVLRDMAKEHLHNSSCPGCMKFAFNYHEPCPPHEHDANKCSKCMENQLLSINCGLKTHIHDADGCLLCHNLWAEGEKFGRENHVVKQPAPIVHTVEKEVVVYKDMPTHWIHATWAMISLILWAIGFISGYGPNWAGPLKPGEYIVSPGAVRPPINEPVSAGAFKPTEYVVASSGSYLIPKGAGAVRP